MNQTCLGLGVIVDTGICCSSKAIICLLGFTLLCHNEGILEKDIKPLVKRDPVVVSRYNILKRLIGNSSPCEARLLE